MCSHLVVSLLFRISAYRASFVHQRNGGQPYEWTTLIVGSAFHASVEFTYHFSVPVSNVKPKRKRAPSAVVETLNNQDETGSAPAANSECCVSEVCTC